MKPIVFNECSDPGPLHNMPMIWVQYLGLDWYRIPSTIDCFGNAVPVDWDKVRIHYSNTSH